MTISLLLALVTSTGPAAAQSSSLYVTDGQTNRPPRRSLDRRPSVRRSQAADQQRPPRRAAGGRRFSAQPSVSAQNNRPAQRGGGGGYRSSHGRRNIQPVTATRKDVPRGNPYLQRGSYMAVRAPDVRQFAEHDLITIIIREQASATSESTLETEKELDLSGEVGAFPRLKLAELLEGQLNPSSSPEDLPAVEVTGTNEFTGEGEYERTDSMTTRLTARVADIKPNGTLALEARTRVKNDREKMTIKVTGYCRPRDVTPNNTVLSTQLYDLRVSKQNAGELRDASEKGWITNVLELIFNF